MNRLWLEVEDQHLVLDGDVDMNQSRVQIYNDCHRKYAWQFYQHLTPDRPQWALQDGKAVHEALAHLTAGAPLLDAIRVARNLLAEGMPKRKLPGDDTLLAEHQDMVARLLTAYLDTYGTDTTWVPFAQEVSGRVEVGEGTGVYLDFRTDKLATWAQQLWIVDHKTAARLDLRDVQKYAMDLQFTAYVYGTRKVLQRKVAGVIVDLLVKTQTPQFHRDLFKRTDDDLLEFEQEFVEVSREIALRHRRADHGQNWKTVFYKNTRECFRYGTCPYRPLCLDDNGVNRAEFVLRAPDYVDAAATPRLPTDPTGQLPNVTVPGSDSDVD